MKFTFLILLMTLLTSAFHIGRAGVIPSDIDSSKNISFFESVKEEEPRKDSVRSTPASTKTLRTIMKKSEYLFIGD